MPTVHPDIPAVVLHWSGDIDLARADELGRAIDDIVVVPGQRIVVDVADVTFMDSSGLNLLVRLHRLTEAQGGSVHLMRPTAQVTRVLELTGLDRVLITDATTPPDPDDC